MRKYICHSKAKEQFDYLGKSLGIGHDRSLYYSRNVGKHRIYRSCYPMLNHRELVLFEFDNEHEAVEFCHEINEAYNDDFKPLVYEAVEQ